MQPTVTSSYFLDGGFACYCKMAALAFIVCADWAHSCLPLSRTHSGLLEADENENKLTGKLTVIIAISCGPFTLALVTKVQKSSKTLENIPISVS